MSTNAEAWAAIASEVTLDADRQFEDVQLGLYDLIDEVIFNRRYFSQFRTVSDFHAARDAILDLIQEHATGHERERLQFELVIENAIRDRYSSLPPDLGPDGILDQAFAASMSKCASDAGYPEIVLDNRTTEELRRYEIEYDLDAEAFYDLRKRCALRAATHPTLDPRVRDELVNRTRLHLLIEIYDYLREYDLAEIPIEHHVGMVHPLEEIYIAFCMEHPVEARPQCADQYRVDLTHDELSLPLPGPVAADETLPYPLVGLKCNSHLPGYEAIAILPGLVNLDREGSVCDKFENLEFLINHPETEESKAYVADYFFGGARLLNCPVTWLTDVEGKCRYPYPEEALLRDAFVEAHPEAAAANEIVIYSSKYPDKD